MREKQLTLLKKLPLAYGGELRNTRAGRAHGRPLDTKNSMHLVLRSSKAKGRWSFLHPKNKNRIKDILNRFALKWGVDIYSVANVGNHLHIHMKLYNRHTYRPFIRAVTAAIAMAVTGASRWKPLKAQDANSNSGRQFWDYRPYTRVVRSFRAILNMRDYIQINKLEGYGVNRGVAEYLVKGMRRRRPAATNSS